MYCRFCGKEIVDGARFCGFCGKEQEVNVEPKKAEDKKADPFTLFCTIFTWAIQVTIAILSFCPFCNVKIGNDFFATKLSFNFIDLFECGDVFSKYLSFSDTANSISEKMIGLSVVIIFAIGVCFLYFIYNIVTYFFAKQSQYVSALGYTIESYSLQKIASKLSVLGRHYINYSVLPDFFLITVMTIGVIVPHTLLGDYGSASPSAPLIIIYVLTAIQCTVNIIYKNI